MPILKHPEAPPAMKDIRLSRTAAFIAIKCYGLTRMAACRQLFDEETIRYYDRVVRNLPDPLAVWHKILRNKTLRPLLYRLDELLLAGDMRHILMRKLLITQMIRRLREKDFEQLIVLGAGFDHLATLTSKSGMQAIEIDRPRMVAFKRQFSDKYGYSNKRLIFETADFENTGLKNKFSGIAELDAGKKTVIVTEGFFDYLTAEKSQQMLHDISTFFREEVNIVSTVFALDELGSFHRFTFRAGVRLAGERLRLELNKTQFIELFNRSGIQLKSVIGREEMQQILPPSLRGDGALLAGFYLLRAGCNRN